ncbi:hypothetical protein U1Q18_047136 [Sarracenia purpurea var. burkii]
MFAIADEQIWRKPSLEHSMHCFEGPDWLHLKRGRESFATGPLVKVDPQGRCAGVLVYGLQMIILRAAEAGSGLVVEDNAFTAGGAVSARIESSYIISLKDLDMKHVKDFIFVHGETKQLSPIDFACKC